MQPLQDNGTAYNVYQIYIHSAKKRNLDFDISYQHFLELTRMNCNYCGASPSRIRKRKIKKTGSEGYYIYDDFIYNGLDRVDNLRGYDVGNVVTCCQNCNYAKRKMTVEEFLIWVRSVYEYQIARIELEGL